VIWLELHGLLFLMIWLKLRKNLFDCFLYSIEQVTESDQLNVLIIAGIPSALSPADFGSAGE